METYGTAAPGDGWRGRNYHVLVDRLMPTSTAAAAAAGARHPWKREGVRHRLLSVSLAQARGGEKEKGKRTGDGRAGREQEAGS